MLEIGNLKINPRFILSPMSGISDLPFRMINRSFGCGLAFTEMVSARSLVYRNTKTLKRLSTLPSDRPLGIQLLCADIEIMPRALEILQKYEFDCMDLNAACPSKKVTRRGEGAALLKDVQKLNKLLRIMVDNSNVPVTVKIRAGWDASSINAKEAAFSAQDAGISGLFVHGRTRAQGYSGNVDYSVIRDVKNSLQIPVIASGDALSPDLIKRMFDETGCDGVAVARGALGNPWIFHQTTEVLKNSKVVQTPVLEEITGVMHRHLILCCDYYGDRMGTMLFRKFFVWYTKGLKNVKSLRKKAFHAGTKKQMTGIINELCPVSMQSKSGHAC